MKRVIILLVMIGIGNVVWAEGPPVEWEKTFGEVNSVERGRSVRQTTDGGYIITGSIYSPIDGTNVLLIKTEPNGNSLWEKTFEEGSGYSVQQTTDGGYIIGGTGSSSALLIKSDSYGNKIWKKTFSGIYSVIGESVLQTLDGGYILLGWTDSFGAGLTDFWLIKTEPNGTEIWSKTYGGVDHEYGYSVQQTSDGGFIITGYTESYGAGGADMWLIKTDLDGNEIWNKTFGGSGNDYGFSVMQTTDGGYIVTGETFSNGTGNGHLWLIKTDFNGNILWEKTFEKSNNSWGYSVQQTLDGGYIVAGTDTGLLDVWIMKTDAYGNGIWEKTFGTGSNSWGYSVQQTTDGGYIICGDKVGYNGQPPPDVYLIKLSADCINQPKSDLTGDCKTDFKDFSVMSSEWLDCGQYDPNDCL